MRYRLIIWVMFFLNCLQCFAEPANPKAYLEMLFEKKGGYIIPSEEVDQIRKEGGHEQYGEIPYDSAAHLLDDLQLSRQDVFYDLGSGTGKLVLQVYMTTPVKRSVGIELSPTRWAIAEIARKQAAADEHVILGRDLNFLNQSIQKTALTDATVCFISGLTFPPDLIKSVMDRLSTLDHDVKVISVMNLPPHDRFRLIKTYNLAMSWAPEGVDVCLYQVTPAQQSDPALKKQNKKKKRKRELIED
ncbi:MAG: hypothetical protein FJX03_00515 [Alphaproteobacteria bacterium]|nr:hypothetical protein [Alphaproteobacteria bacterium]